MREGTDPGRRRRTIASGAAGVLLAAGLAGIGFGLAHGAAGPAPSDAATAPAATAPLSAPPTPGSADTGAGQQDPGQAAAPAPAPSGPVLPAADPVRLEAASIGVDTALIRLGRQPDGEVAVPPGDPGSPAGWYTGSVAPGAIGSAVVLGHVNAIGTPVGVFYRLHELAPGAQVTVVRSDHTAAVFAVDRVDVYHKAAFPTVDVYRNADRPELRLITCGGYDPASGQYLDNTVAYAHLVASHPA